MIDDEYLARFEDWFGNADTLTWCATTSLADVLNAYGVAADQVRTGEISFLDEFRLFVGKLGNGTLVVQSNGYPKDDVLSALSLSGPCLSVGWSDTTPPGVSYLAEGRLVVSFDPFEWDFASVPDPQSVEEWAESTAAGPEMWDDHWAVAALVTAESLCQARVDDEWVRTPHTVIF
ncbi:hypothetical protein [Acrocarpospora catenulata]|uniref:hypothetical protein n=1 Tax=Acrocarpospora catenulata TaxID=2836182 RepID=UPI001BDB0EF3|nr:hypothetical protein [Acrocarpospora catenulata]